MEKCVRKANLKCISKRSAMNKRAPGPKNPSRMTRWGTISIVELDTAPTALYQSFSAPGLHFRLGNSLLLADILRFAGCLTPFQDSPYQIPAVAHLPVMTTQNACRCWQMPPFLEHGKISPGGEQTRVGWFLIPTTKNVNQVSKHMFCFCAYRTITKALLKSG